jgi:hypothetical protein
MCVTNEGIGGFFYRFFQLMPTSPPAAQKENPSLLFQLDGDLW